MSNDPTTPPPGQRRQSFSLPYAYTSPIALAAAQTLRRTSTTATTTTGRPRADSFSSLSSSVGSSIPSAADDVPIEEDEEGSSPTDVRARLERRMSIGNRWVPPRAGSLSLGGVPAGQVSPTITRGFWLDPSIRTRRQSISTMPLPEQHNSGQEQQRSAARGRRASVSVTPGVDDHMQERILKGEFIF